MNLHTLQIILLSFLLLFYGCKKNNPVSVVDESKGKIFVTANVSGAEIFLDNISTGKFTPDTITAFATGYVVKVRKESFFSEKKRVIFDRYKTKTVKFELQKNQLHKNVLLEYFPRNDTGNCINGNELISELKDDFKDSLFLLNYTSLNLPPSNPFYFTLHQSIGYRMKNYNVLNTPIIIIDGNKIQDFNNIEILKDKIKKGLHETTYFKLTVSDSILTANGFKVTARLTVYDTDKLDFNSLVLHMVVFEKIPACTIDNGETCGNVVRAMLPSEYGRDLSAISKKGLYNYYEYKLLNPDWKKLNLFVVAFVQNKLTNKIWQVAKSEQNFWF